MAYDFNGSSQYLSAASAPRTEVPLSLHAWAYPTSDSAGQTLVALTKSAEDTQSFRISLQGNVAGDPARMETWNTLTGGPAQADSTAAFSPNVWSAVTGTSGATNTRTIFLNGVAQATNTTSVTPQGITGLSIGVLLRATIAGYMVGRLAEVAVWSVALTDAEVASLAKGFKPTRIRPQSLVFYAPLVRDLSDLKGALALTNTNTATVAAHPRVH